MKSHVLETIEDVDDEEMFYFTKDEKKPELEYYKNSIIHWFIPQAFVSLSLLTGNREITPKENVAKDYLFLKNVFRYEFIYEETTRTPLEEANHVLDHFFESRLLVKSNVSAGYSLTRLGIEQTTLWANLIKTFLESYWIAAGVVLKRRQNGKKRTDLLKSMTNLGQRYYRLGLIDHIESVSQITFKNAIGMIQEDFRVSEDSSEENRNQSLENLALFGKRLHQFSHYNQ